MNFGVLSKQIELSDWHSSLTSSLSCCCLWPYFWSNLKNLVGEIYQILFILDQFYHPTCLKGQKCDRFFHTQVGWKKWEVSLQILLASFLDALQINYLLYLCHTSSFMKKVTSISDSEVEKIMKSRSKNSSKYQNAVCPFFYPMYWLIYCRAVPEVTFMCASLLSVRRLLRVITFGPLSSKPSPSPEPEISSSSFCQRT